MLYVVWSFPASSETFILNQITGLIDRGHAVSILSLGPADLQGLHGDIAAYGLLERTSYLVVSENSSQLKVMRNQESRS